MSFAEIWSIVRKMIWRWGKCSSRVFAGSLSKLSDRMGGSDSFWNYFGLCYLEIGGQSGDLFINGVIFVSSLCKFSTTKLNQPYFGGLLFRTLTSCCLVYWNTLLLELLQKVPQEVIKRTDKPISSCHHEEILAFQYHELRRYFSRSHQKTMLLIDLIFTFLPSSTHRSRAAKITTCVDSV